MPIFSTGSQGFFWQFVSVTFSGATLTFIWNWLKDKETQRQSMLTYLREQISNLDQQYRLSKHIKRMMRSRVFEVENTRQIDDEFFRQQMTSLSNVQLEIEMALNRLRGRPDILAPDRLGRISDYVQYSSNYLRSIIGDYEQRKVNLNEKSYVIDAKCPNVLDFISPAWRPNADQISDWRCFQSGDSKSLTTDTTSAGRSKIEEEENFDALLPIFEKRATAFKKLKSQKLSNSGSARTRSLSDACMRLAMRELRDEIVISKSIVQSLVAKSIEQSRAAFQQNRSRQGI